MVSRFSGSLGEKANAPPLAFIETRESLQRETLRSGHIFFLWSTLLVSLHNLRTSRVSKLFETERIRSS